ncbi:MAG: type II toxin-antitoxin system HipA family toxin [Thermodesulfobacteriota bacterium]|nr:type II toxin-antitoxin system HipA family toxin [Thermodesulfobacteriota bacterium]
MVKSVDVAYVKIWDQVVGAVSWQGNPMEGYAVFEFDRTFLNTGLDLSPLHMSVESALRGDGRYLFSKRSEDPSRDTFMGLPGLLADCLPDKFGNRLIDMWLQRQGRDSSSFTPVERLCYTGSRGMGALEFVPTLNKKLSESTPVEIYRLVELAQQITSERNALNVSVAEDTEIDSDALLEIIRVGTSAGGARAKAIVAMNNEGHIVSGQTRIPEGYEHWIIKFDGVTDLELGASQDFGRIEYGYYLMAKEAGIDMPVCKLLGGKEGRAHFMIKRFDRENNDKIHMQSLCGLAHYDFNEAGMFGYEQAFGVMRTLRLSKAEAAQQFRRMVFNVVSRNQDDHTKNISFLMDRDGKWRLSPAYDVTYAHNPGGLWTNSHQMSISGKRDGFELQDLLVVGKSIGIPKPEVVVGEVVDAISRWDEFAKEAGVKKETLNAIGATHRLSLTSS